MDLGDMPLMSLSALKQAHVVLIAECLIYTHKQTQVRILKKLLTEMRVQLLIHLV